MSPRRRREDEGPRDLDALRARLAEAQRAPKKSRAERTGAARRRDVTPDEPFEDDPEATFDDVRGEELGDERWWEHEEVGRPRPVVGGISARTRKGPIGATWWSRRFLESLESVMVGGRMERGRTYARRGQVVDLHVGPGVVAATVQGSREDPYAVHLRMAVVPEDDWDRVVRVLAARAGYAARMLAGELPHDVEEVFASQGASLLPAPHARLVTECTCPDWENPCKHIAAVCYLLAEEFDRDPFSLLAWRGRDRADVLGALRTFRREGAGVPVGGVVHADAGSAAAEVDAGTVATEAEDADDRDLLGRFWEEGPGLARVRVLPEESPAPAVALRLAPRGTLVVRGGDLVDVLAPAYRAIAAAAAARARR